MPTPYFPLFLEVSFTCRRCDRDSVLWAADSEEGPPVEGQFWNCPGCNAVYRFGMIPAAGEEDGEYLAIRFASRDELLRVGGLLPAAELPPQARAS